MKLELWGFLESERVVKQMTGVGRIVGHEVSPGLRQGDPHKLWSSVLGAFDEWVVRKQKNKNGKIEE